ncbi:hypothetical protein KCP73_01900 [Salmonella enterica subsp. enterica]|nr:hypothetical protein KCP73_01900 [Salmonella enterica subsp. enterica]
MRLRYGQSDVAFNPTVAVSSGNGRALSLLAKSMRRAIPHGGNLAAWLTTNFCVIVMALCIAANKGQRDAARQQVLRALSL